MEKMGIPSFVDKYVLSGFNFPPSQCHLHLQFILPPYLPSNSAPQVEANRFFPFQYVVRVLDELIRRGARLDFESIDGLTGTELIQLIYSRLGIDYMEFFAATVGRNQANSDHCANWIEENFKYKIKKGTEKFDGRSVFDIIKGDKAVIHSYGKDSEGRTVLQFYLYVKEPGELKEW